jgi:hypothetical protein
MQGSSIEREPLVAMFSARFEGGVGAVDQLGAFDSLRLHHRVDWPLSMIITEV